jgi:hypothetical protein
MSPSASENGPSDRRFPALPIITPDGPRRPDRERFGALFWLGLGGLAVVLGLLGWFGWSVWSMRSVWANVYVLHDARKTEAERVDAAYALSRDGRVNQRQLWDISLRRALPPLARYAVAEGLTAEAAAADPRGYALAVARSEGWPVWLRLLLIRPLAYRAAIGLPIPHEPLDELSRGPDPATALWATYALACPGVRAPGAFEALERAANTNGPERPLAGLLLAASTAPRPEQRLTALDQATRWLRTGHPEAARLWQGWAVEAGHLARRPAPELHEDTERSTGAR